MPTARSDRRRVFSGMNVDICTFESRHGKLVFVACGSGSSPPNLGSQKLGSPTYPCSRQEDVASSQTLLEVRDTFGEVRDTLEVRDAWRSETRLEVRDTSGGARHVRDASVSPTRGYFFTGSDLQTRLEVRGVGLFYHSDIQTRPEVRLEVVHAQPSRRVRRSDARAFSSLRGRNLGWTGPTAASQRPVAGSDLQTRPEARGRACFTVDL